MGEDFFWAINPMAGDYVLFKFDRPVNIERSVATSSVPALCKCLEVQVDMDSNVQKFENIAVTVLGLFNFNLV